MQSENCCYVHLSLKSLSILVLNTMVISTCCMGVLQVSEMCSCVFVVQTVSLSLLLCVLYDVWHWLGCVLSLFVRLL